MEPVAKKPRTGYLERNLITGEEVTFRGRVHWIVLFWPVVIGVLLGVPGLVLVYARAFSQANGITWMVIAGIALLAATVVVMLPAVVRRQATIFAVTNKRIILKEGVVKVRTEEILIQKIESITVNQGFLGQVLHY